jgi:hypothetical protein
VICRGRVVVLPAHDRGDERIGLLAERIGLLMSGAAS